MADFIESPKWQSLGEIRVWDFDFTNDLRSGESIASATAAHIPPSGSATTPTVGAISNNIVPVKLTIGTSGAVGKHVLVCIGTTSPGGEKIEMRVEITVNF